MKTLYLSLLLITLSLGTSVSSPVFRIKKTVVQSDGTKLEILRTGANHLLYYVTSDGMPVFPDTKGNYCYAEFDERGCVIASSVVAHEYNLRSVTETCLAEKYAADFETYIRMHNLTRYGVGTLSAASVKNKGDVRIAVILAEFQDLSFKEENDIERFNKHFNASNYQEEGGAGSVRDYFIAQSDSAFRPIFDIVAKVKLNNTAKYYGENSGLNDRRAKTYIADAASAAVAQGVDFSKYKNEKDEVFVIVIYPGHGEQVSGETDQLWASYHYTMSHTVGGAKFAAGLVMDELANYGLGEMFDGIGTLCHELSHALGLPDFYNTNSYTNIFGMDAWSIMDYGQYCNISRTPVGYTAYEREFMGWLEIETLTNTKQYVSLAPLHSTEGHRAYRIPNPADDTGNEYYIIENRQQSPWYLSTYGTGMLVNHVDYNSNAWSSNTVNNAITHQRMTIIPADNVLTKISSKAKDYKGDLFPGSNGVTEFSKTTTPATKVNKGENMDIRMKDIHVSSGNVEFYYQCDGELSQPTELNTETIGQDGFVLSFNNIENATQYVVKISQNETLLLSDTISTTTTSFSGLQKGDVYVVSVCAIADNYLDSESLEKNVIIGFVRGDVNNDGIINSADVVSVYNYIIRGENSGVSALFADVNSDNNINSADVLFIYNNIISIGNK